MEFVGLTHTQSSSVRTGDPTATSEGVQKAPQGTALFVVVFEAHLFFLHPRVSQAVKHNPSTRKRSLLLEL